MQGKNWLEILTGGGTKNRSDYIASADDFRSGEIRFMAFPHRPIRVFDGETSILTEGAGGNPIFSPGVMVYCSGYRVGINKLAIAFCVTLNSMS